MTFRPIMSKCFRKKAGALAVSGLCQNGGLQSPRVLSNNCSLKANPNGLKTSHACTVRCASCVRRRA